MNNNKNLDRLFKEKFKEFEADPQAGSWEKIQRGINISNEKVKIHQKNNYIYSKIFYVTASCCFITLTAGITNYMFKSNTKSSPTVEKVYYERSNFDYFSEYELIHKKKLQQDLFNNIADLKKQLNNRVKSELVFTKTSPTKATTKVKPIVSSVINESLEIIDTNKLNLAHEISLQEIVETNFVSVENMIVDESIGQTINDNDLQKVLKSENIVEPTIVVTSNGNRVLRVNSNKKTENTRIINTKIDSTTLTQDELKIINQNKKRFKK